MILIILLSLISFGFSQQIDFMIFGISTNMTVIYSAESTCNFDSCPKVICNLFKNTTSAYIALYPLKKITSCPKLITNFNVNMISFVFDANQQISFPSACYTINDCIMKSCNSFLSSKNSYFMAFTGECLL